MGRAGSMILVLMMIGCGPGPGDGDAGHLEDSPEMDGGPDLEVGSRLDGGGDANACEGVEQGYTVCPGDTRMCCDGSWTRFFDGPCWGAPDAGGADAGPPCVVNPQEAGCPCTVEGDVYCTPTTWRRECTGGVWTERANIGCCMGDYTD